MQIRIRRRIDESYRRGLRATFFRALLRSRDYFPQALDLLLASLARNWSRVDDARISCAPI